MVQALHGGKEVAPQEIARLYPQPLSHFKGEVRSKRHTREFLSLYFDSNRATTPPSPSDERRQTFCPNHNVLRRAGDSSGKPPRGSVDAMASTRHTPSRALPLQIGQLVRLQDEGKLMDEGAAKEKEGSKLAYKYSSLVADLFASFDFNFGAKERVGRACATPPFQTVLTRTRTPLQGWYFAAFFADPSAYVYERGKKGSGDTCASGSGSLTRCVVAHSGGQGMAAGTAPSWRLSLPCHQLPHGLRCAAHGGQLRGRLAGPV